ncbi:MAG: metal ABC transporter permease [bacterium]|nr:metal ABC transporter permease [bacterium]
MIELLSYQFMQRALAAGIIISLVCGVLSFFVVLRRLSFIGVGLSHAAFGGVALGFFLGVEPTWTAIVFCAVIALLIGLVKHKGRIQEDTAIGIFFAANMAFGVMLIGLSHRYNVDLFGYLFGNILAITAYDLKMIAVVSFLVLAVVALFFKELLFCSFDEEMAGVCSVPAVPLNYLFMVLLSLVIVVSIKVVGIVLVSALLVIPAAAGRQFSSNYRGMLLASVLVGLLSTFGGLFLSYRFDLPSGSTIVLLATFIFGLSFLRERMRK